jgi:protein-tyrosine-phosphatase
MTWLSGACLYGQRPCSPGRGLLLHGKRRWPPSGYSGLGRRVSDLRTHRLPVGRCRSGLNGRDPPSRIAKEGMPLCSQQPEQARANEVAAKRVLIICSGNSARSQIAEGLIRYEGGDPYGVYSAGTDPAEVRTEAIQLMRELRIDISKHRSKTLEDFAGQAFDFVITVCDRARGELSPRFQGSRCAYLMDADRLRARQVPRGSNVGSAIASLVSRLNSASPDGEWWLRRTISKPAER